MKKSLMGVLFVLGVALLGNMAMAAAQENNAANEDKFSFGKIVSVNAQELTVKEYDFAKDADVDAVYVITTETELGNVNAVTDLAVDDDVVIDYTEKDGKRVITTLVKEDKGAEAPMADMPVPEAAAPEAAAPEAAPAAVDAPVVEQK
jgi:uncharacterized protein YuzE